MRQTLLAFVLFSASWAFAAPPAKPATASPFPTVISGYGTEGRAETYDRETVYKYMDGGAEVYLAYGMRSLLVQKYARNGEPAITFDLFEMDSPAGAFGAFTFEREDDGAGIGQDSEYGGGLLRFWQGRYFAFIQTEQETPASRNAVLALGKAVVGSLGSPGEAPDLPSLLRADDLRPKSVRYIRSPLLLEVLEPQFGGNPLGLPSPCDAALGRYGVKGNTERVVVVRLPDEKAATSALEALLRAWTKGTAKPSEPFLRGGTWTAARSDGPVVTVVLGAAAGEVVSKRFEKLTPKLKGESP